MTRRDNLACWFGCLIAALVISGLMFAILVKGTAA